MTTYARLHLWIVCSNWCDFAFRIQSQISLREGVVKSNSVINKSSATTAAPIVKLYPDREKPKPKVIKQATAQPSKIVSADVKPTSTEAPTNEVFNELKEKTDTVRTKDNEEVDVFSGQRFEILDIDVNDGNNPLLLKDYIQDICDYLFMLEVCCFYKHRIYFVICWPT